MEKRLRGLEQDHDADFINGDAMRTEKEQASGGSPSLHRLASIGRRRPSRPNGQQDETSERPKAANEQSATRSRPIIRATPAANGLKPALRARRRTMGNDSRASTLKGSPKGQKGGQEQKVLLAIPTRRYMAEYEQKKPERLGGDALSFVAWRGPQSGA
ncbi:hypothetical protein CMQ_4240 [Grosmannia clavigera kw1407]|uniref:Uncharacterized protein n=1 Tax=Grosmannia clavigera (strain kw1407 / UAMH 11150) TaxID=655863 RepID=F0X9P4_GROCL|nr:uncharacterized protein CMQ_4240 [Grosmannia clavigera kw1407]EFX06171.1 hypothetical protein CMQ_4240 [Grosmannia clavigera kw1407]